MSNLLSQASLVMIPSGYKEDVVYSQIPTNGNGDLSFTRASNGTRINSAGLVEVCPWNLITYSEQFQNANWIGGGNGKPTMTDNFAEAPNGTMTASKMEAVSDGYQLRQNNAQENTQMNLSVWLRTNTGTKTIQLFLNNANTASQNITVTTNWTRYEISGLVTSLSGGGRNGLNTLEALTSSNYILVWGFQLSVGLTAKPYFPTTDRLNVPRLTYQNGGGGCPSLLLEPQRTNLATYSENFSAVYSGINASISNDTTSAPNGTTTADSLLETTATDIHAIYTDYTQSSGVQYTYSVYVKSISGRNVRISGSSGFTGPIALVDLSNGSLLSGSTGASVESVGNGWYRISITATTTTTAVRVLIYSMNGTATTFAGSTSNGVYIWGAQLEAGSYKTSYIPTTSASATRVADACFKTGISSLIGQSQGTLFIDFQLNQAPSDANGRLLQVWATNDTTNAILPLVNQSRQLQISFFGSSAGSPTIQADASTLLGLGRNKIAVAYTSTSVVVYRNGVLFASGNPTGFFPTSLTSLDLGGSSFATRNLGNPINQAVIFPTRLTNAELAQLTA